MNALTFMNGWAAAWTAAMGRACGQGVLFLLGVWLVCRLLPRLPARVRCDLWGLGCAKLLIGLLWLAPVALPLLPAEAPIPDAKREMSALRPSPPDQPAVSAPPPVASSGGKSPVAPVPSRPSAAEPFPTPRIAMSEEPERLALATALFGLWYVGVALYGGLLLRQGIALRRLVRRAQPLQDAWLCETAGALAQAFGLRRPVPLPSALSPGRPHRQNQNRPVAVTTGRPRGLLSRPDTPTHRSLQYRQRGHDALQRFRT